MFSQYTGIWNQGAEAPFHPTDLASAVAIWEADVTVEESDASFPEDGDEVYKWIDQTTNAYEAERDVSGPLWEETTGINSGESLIWEGGTNTDYLVVTGSDSSPLLSATGDWHMFIINSYNSVDGDTTALFGQGDTNTANNGNIYVINRQTGTTFRTQLRVESDGTAIDFALNNNITSTDVEMLVEVKRVGVDFTTIVNGTSATGATSSGHAIQQDGFVIGGRGAPWGTTYGAKWQGTMAAFYVFSAEITGTDYTNLTSYISTKYGV